MAQGRAERGPSPLTQGPQGTLLKDMSGKSKGEQREAGECFDTLSLSRASRSFARTGFIFFYRTLHFTCVLPMLSHLEGSRSELNFKIISRWFQTSQNAAQNGAKTSPLDDFLAHLGAKMAPRCATCAHFWEHLGDFFWILGAILPKLAKA